MSTDLMFHTSGITLLKCILFLHDSSLGSTRFFKVAKALSNEGLIVVKVFVLHDLSLLLQPYQQRIEDIRSKLASAFNCLPFRKAIVSLSNHYFSEYRDGHDDLILRSKRLLL